MPTRNEHDRRGCAAHGGRRTCIPPSSGVSASDTARVSPEARGDALAVQSAERSRTVAAPPCGGSGRDRRRRARRVRRGAIGYRSSTTSAVVSRADDRRRSVQAMPRTRGQRPQRASSTHVAQSATLCGSRTDLHAPVREIALRPHQGRARGARTRADVGRGDHAVAAEHAAISPAEQRPGRVSEGRDRSRPPPVEPAEPAARRPRDLVRRHRGAGRNQSVGAEVIDCDAGASRGVACEGRHAPPHRSVRGRAERPSGLPVEPLRRPA